jgi:predicted Zn-dependent peptidase
MPSFKISKLSNGVEFITAKNKNVDLVCLSIAIRVGSSDEETNVHGISHLVEHMLFKSNRVYKTKFELYNALDNIGAVYNAYTDKNITNFYAKCHYTKIKELINIFSVLICEPAINESDLDKERNIVIEEINNSRDDPIENIYNKLFKFTYEGYPISRNVSGTPNNIKNITREDIFSHLRKYYVAGNLVLGITGKIPKTEEIKEFLEKSSFVKIPQPIENHPFRKKIDTPNKTNISIVKVETKQTYLAIAFPTNGYYTNDKYVLQLINCILNGSMSSRLFIKVREENGLVYSISSDLNNYEEGGIYTILTSFETDASKSIEVITAIINELIDISENGVKEEELEKWKNYLRSIFSISHEDTSSICDYYVRQLLFFRDTVMDYRDLFVNFEKVTTKDIKEVAKNILTYKKMKIIMAGNYSIDNNDNVVKISELLKKLYNF